MILPLAVPLLLFSANLRVVFKSTGRLVPLFCFGSVGTLLGGVVGYAIVPLLSLGDEAWKVCAALTSRHIGGAVNYVAVANVLNVSPKVLGAGLAADNLCNVLYFALLFYLARDAEYKDEKSASAGGAEGQNEIAKEDSSGKGFSTYNASAAIAYSAVSCYLSKSLSMLINNGSASLTIPIATVFSVLVATTFPKQCKEVAQSGEALAALAMNAFFSTVVHPSSTMARRADGRSNDSPAGARRGGLFVLLARAPTRTREGRGLAGARARAGRGVYALPNARGGDDQPRSIEHGSGERRALENESRRSIAEEKKEVESEDSGRSGVCARLSARFAVFQWAGASRRRHRSHLVNASSRGRAAEPGGAGAHAAMPTTPKRGTATVPDSYESPAPRCVRARLHDPEPRSRSSPRRGLARLGRPRTPFFRDR